MRPIYKATTASEVLPSILADLLERGDEVGSRNGLVKEFLNAQITLTYPTQREILSLNRKANVFAQIAETMWVLAGRNDIEWLSAYLPRAKDYSDDGQTWRAAYGRRIRHWNNNPGDAGLDQLAYVVDALKADPLSRQAVICIWDPEVDTTPGKDKACNDLLQFQSRLGRLHLTVTVRSNDVMWGWSGINAFEWSTLQEMVASMLGIGVGHLTFNIGSLHLYGQHWQRASRIEYEDVHHDTVRFDPHKRVRSVEDLDVLIGQWFEWEALCRDGEATPEALVLMKEPLLASWAAAIAYFWQRDEVWLEHLSGTALGVAVARTPASVLSEAPQTSRSAATGAGTHPPSHERVQAFYDFVKNLHAKKHASYGDSWKKRGEKLSILANMARKVDRLGVGDEYDSSADTLIDLLVYTIKYGCWLRNRVDGPEGVNPMLEHFLDETKEVSTEGEALDITYFDIADDFNRYCDAVDDLSLDQKVDFVAELALRVAPIARDVWLAENHDGDDYRGADVE